MSHASTKNSVSSLKVGDRLFSPATGDTFEVTQVTDTHFSWRVLGLSYSGESRLASYNDSIYSGDLIFVSRPENKACECGAEKTGTLHSHWCPQYA